MIFLTNEKHNIVYKDHGVHVLASRNLTSGQTEASSRRFSHIIDHEAQLSSACMRSTQNILSLFRSRPLESCTDGSRRCSSGHGPGQHMCFTQSSNAMFRWETESKFRSSKPGRKMHLKETQLFLALLASLQLASVRGPAPENVCGQRIGDRAGSFHVETAPLA